MRWLLLAVMCATSGAWGQDYSYTIDFEQTPAGQAGAREFLADGDTDSARHLSCDGEEVFGEGITCEVADGAGPDGSRALMMVDASETQALHGFFRVLGEDGAGAAGLTVGALRFDVCFDALPTRSFSLGRRNFGAQFGSDGRLVSPWGIDPPEYGRTGDFVRDWFVFEQGAWYSLLIQYDFAGDVDHEGGGAYSIFARRWDGPNEFGDGDLIIRGGSYVHNNNDQWGRLVEPLYADKRSTCSWRIDNFEISAGRAWHLPSGEKQKTVLLDPVAIVVPEDTGGEALAGARELSDYIHKATGQRVPVQRGDAPDVPRIEVGTVAAQAAVTDALASVTSADSFALATGDGVLYVAGRSDLATRYGCYEVLERFLGVRWYMPGEMGEVVPSAAHVRIPECAIVSEPALWHRWCSGLLCDFGDVNLWLKRMRMRPTIQFHHNLLRIFDVKKFGESDPDIYPLIEGQRYIPEPGKFDWQPCLTNPRAVEITMQYAREQFGKGAPSISLGINDSHRYCECDQCMKFVREDEPRQMRRSRWFLQYANEVGRQVAEEFPDKLIGYLAYGETLDIPEDVQAEPNLVPFLVNKAADLNPDGQIDLTRWQTDTPSWERLDAWHEMIQRTHQHFPKYALYDWYFGAGRKAAPNLQHDAMQHYLRYATANGCVGLYVESYANWGLDGHKYHFYYKTVWDAAYDARDALGEFYVRFFGRAAGPMKAYCEYVETLTFIDGAGPETLDPYTPEAVAHCRELLSQATQAARGERQVIRDRVKYYADAFGLTATMATRWHAAVRARALLDEQAPLAEVIKALAAGWGPENDLELYYRWVLAGDRYQVRRPGARHLNQYPGVYAAVLERLKVEGGADAVATIRAGIGDTPRALELLDALVRDAAQ